MDIVDPLPRTANGNEYIFVVCDFFTKWVKCYALPNHQAQTVADTVVSNLVYRFGVSSVIYSDQRREFSNVYLKKCANCWELRKLEQRHNNLSLTVWLSDSIALSNRC